MDSRNDRQKTVSRVARELGPLVRRQAQELWDSLRVARRNERGHHVWRFRLGSETRERYLRVSHAAMTQVENPAQRLFEQLRAGRWLERLNEGPETAVLLNRAGQVRSWPRH